MLWLKPPEVEIPSKSGNHARCTIAKGEKERYRIKLQEIEIPSQNRNRTRCNIAKGENDRYHMKYQK